MAPFDELQTDDLIETLTFSHPTESPVQESRISDKTAAIALSYHTIGLEQTRDTRLRIASQLEVYQMLANRLDTYLCALYPEDAAVLKKHYLTVFPGKVLRMRSIIVSERSSSVEIEV
ncbi:MAG: hypothetical protein V8T36_09645 [Ruthenibacterium lactatiformans]